MDDRQRGGEEAHQSEEGGMKNGESHQSHPLRIVRSDRLGAEG